MSAEQQTAVTKEDWREKLDARQKIGFALDNGFHFDVEFLVGDRKVSFKAHKLMLSIASPVLDAMFFGNTREPMNIINVPDLDPVGFKSFLRYIYTGEVELNTADDLYEVYLLADRYIVLDLKGVCRDKLCDITLELSNIWKVLRNAILMEAESAQEKCVEFISRFPGKEIFSSQHFLETSFKALERVLNSNALFVSEGDVLECVALWGQHNANKNNVQLKELLRPLLSLIRFDALTVEQCCSLTEKYRNLMTESDSLAILKYLINKKCYKLPAWCCSAAPREIVLDCEMETGACSSDNTIVEESFSSTYYLTLKSRGYSPSNWFKLEYVQLGWEYCDVIPNVFNVAISLYTSNYAVIRKKLEVKAVEMEDEEDDSKMRIWIPVEWDKNYSSMYIMTFHVTFGFACRIRLLKTLRIPQPPCRWAFQTDNFPCISDVIVNGITSENVPKHRALQRSEKKYTFTITSEEVEVFTTRGQRNE